MPELRTARERPLSPHLQIYRFTLTMAMSIAHRITGVALYFGSVLLMVWLVAAATGPGSFDMVQQAFGSPLGLLVSLGLTFALLHHAFGGVRHLIWDMALGLDYPAREWLTLGSLVASILVTLLVWGAGLALFLRS